MNQANEGAVEKSVRSHRILFGRIRGLSRGGGALLVGCLLGCQGHGQDPVRLRPDRYRIELDNEFVRVLRSSGEGHARTPVHTRPANIVIHLTDAMGHVDESGRTKSDQHRQRGEVIWSSPQTHEQLKLSGKPYELIQVELKGRRTNAASIPADFDPVKLLPHQFSAVFENEHVRVLRVTRGSQQHATLHRHPPYVGVLLTDSHQRITNADGSVREVKRKAGDITFNPATQHMETNLSAASFEAVLIELK